MKAWISATDSRASASGVGAAANNAGVTWFTFLSVVCAESTTATSSVNGSAWSSGIGGTGYSSSSSAMMRAAFWAMSSRGAAAAAASATPTFRAAGRTSAAAACFTFCRAPTFFFVTTLFVTTVVARTTWQAYPRSRQERKGGRGRAPARQRAGPPKACPAWAEPWAVCVNMQHR